MATGNRQLCERLTPSQELHAEIESFYRRCEAKHLSRHSIEYYRYRFAAFTRYLESQNLTLAPADITPALIRDFLADETTRVSALTAQHSYITLKCFFRFLVNDGVLSENPLQKVEKVKQKKKIIATFSIEQVQALLATCGRDFTGQRDRALMLVLLDCGLRVSELCGLTLENISWHERTLLVLGKGDKERRVPFGATTQRELSAYIARRGHIQGVDAVFVSCYGVPLTRLRVLEVMKDRAKTAGISNVVVSPHNFRRFFAVSYLRNGGDVFSLQKLLGHTSLEMTRRYAELAETDVIAKHREYSPADRLPQAVTSGRKRMR